MRRAAFANQPLYSISGQGLPTPVRPGNIDLANRPRVKNKDGSISTVLSMSFGTPDGEVLVPKVSDDGRIMSDREAMDNYYKTGRSLGVFRTPQEADAYAEALHKQQEQMYTQPSAGLDIGAIWPALNRQESSGNYAAIGPQTKYGQALGGNQLMPGTAQDMAAKLKLPWRPDLLTDTSPQGKQYQDMLGQAYLQQGYDATGNLRDALRYYHGGPNRGIWGRKTNRYADQILSRLGNN